MENLKKFVEGNPQYKSKNEPKSNDWITFKGTGVHYVKLIKGEPSKKQNYRTKKDEQGILLYFLEDGQEKKYFVPTIVESNGVKKFHYLIEKFADIPEGTDLIIEYKNKPGSPQGFLDVRVGKPKQTNDIPVIDAIS